MDSVLICRAHQCVTCMAGGQQGGSRGQVQGEGRVAGPPIAKWRRQPAGALARAAPGTPCRIACTAALGSPGLALTVGGCGLAGEQRLRNARSSAAGRGGPVEELLPAGAQLAARIDPRFAGHGERAGTVPHSGTLTHPLAMSSGQEGGPPPPQQPAQSTAAPESEQAAASASPSEAPPPVEQAATQQRPRAPPGSAVHPAGMLESPVLLCIGQVSRQRPARR